MDEVHHLAFVNGTEFFYSQPELVLDVGVRGMINVIDACRKNNIGNLVLASSSEVYQTPPRVPTDESAPLVGARRCQPALFLRRRQADQRSDGDQFRAQVFRARSHFSPAQCLRPRHGLGTRHPATGAAPASARRKSAVRQIAFRYPGHRGKKRAASATSTIWWRASWSMREKGEHLGIYHLGTTEEIAIADLAQRIAACAEREIELLPGAARAGGTLRRCPDISKLGRLGYKPHVPLDQGLRPTLDWYWKQRAACAKGELTSCVPPKSRAPPAPAQAFRSNAARSAARAVSITCFRSATCRRSTRWCRSGKCRASSRGFRPICCIAATAIWCSSD